MTKRMICGAIVAMAMASGCAAVEAPAQVAAVEALSATGEVCGGIAGFVCPDGQRCLIHDDYPDAMGICVGHDEARRWNDRCSTVLCLAVECPEGHERVITPGRCCGVCVPRRSRDLAEGQCRVASDCEGLVHIMCVGSWSCDAGYCAYTCDMGESLSVE